MSNMICGYRMFFSSSKYSKTRTPLEGDTPSSYPSPIDTFGVSISAPRRLGCQAPNIKFLATHSLCLWRRLLPTSVWYNCVQSLSYSIRIKRLFRFMFWPRMILMRHSDI